MMYRYIPCESCSQFDSLPLTSLLREECGLQTGKALDTPPTCVADAVVRFVRASRVSATDWRRRLRDRRRRGKLRATALAIAAECVVGLPSRLSISHVLSPLAVTTLRVTETVARAAALALAPRNGALLPELALPRTVCRFSDTLEPLPLSTATALQKVSVCYVPLYFVRILLTI